MSVFATANTLAKASLYELDTVSAEPGRISSSAGLSIYADDLSKMHLDSRSTILVVGGDRAPLLHASQDTRCTNWLAANVDRAERYGSICSGAFLLEAAGLLGNKVVSTHWAGCGALREQNDRVTVLADALYHVDGKCWTSAGVTTGIDMALEMLRRDHDKALMQSVAKYLVVYAHRPGKQSQFAQLQDMKTNEEGLFSELLAWLREEVARPIKVSEMADFMCMSERSFQRKFTEGFSISPARFFERMRMEYARDFLLPQLSVDMSARALGYGSVAAFRKSFEKHFGLKPSTIKQIC